MSQAEKIFWWSIGVFFIIFITLTILASTNSQYKEPLTPKPPVINAWMQKIVSSNIVAKNLSKNQQKILSSLNNQMYNTYSTIDKEVDNLFRPIYHNVDTFLDYHYSIIGEYSELGAMAMGNLEKMITDRLLGDEFAQRVDKASLSIDNQYKINLKQHLSIIDKYATDGVDRDINNKALDRLKSDIDANMLQQEIKLGVVGSAIAIKITAIILAKTTAKGAVKASAKLASKSAAVSTGALAGLGCGPLAWLCSPIAAGALWVATDGVVVSGDEYLNRDEFKLEIIRALNDSKRSLKLSYQKTYQKALQDISDKTIKEYEKRPIKEKKMVMENIGL